MRVELTRDEAHEAIRALQQDEKATQRSRQNLARKVARGQVSPFADETRRRLEHHAGLARAAREKIEAAFTDAPMRGQNARDDIAVDR